MKPIVYRGGVVLFRIPAHWREEYSDIDGGMFYEHRFASRILRLKIITAASPKELRSTSGLELLQPFADMLKNEGVESLMRTRNDGNAVLNYKQDGFEQGVRLTIFYWVVANPLPPRHARLATFSYTILAAHRGKSRVQRDLTMLDAEIEAATFSLELGR